MNKRRLALLVVVLSVFMVCSGIVQAESVTDDLDREVEIEEQPEKIVSLAPSNTEILFALELEDEIVGVTESCDYPEEALETKNIGTITEPNLEEIIQLEPDLVVAASINSQEIIDRLEEVGITVLAFDPKSVDEVITTINQIGRVTGQNNTAEELAGNMEARKEKVENKVNENLEERPTVFYEIWNDPLTTAGPDTFIDNLIELAGGENIARDAEEEWPQYSMEVLLEKNPEVYLSTGHSGEEEVTEESIAERDNYDQITAIKEGRIAIFDEDIVNRGGPRIIEGLEEIAEALHPELFKD